MHEKLAELCAYRIPGEDFVWYGDNPHAKPSGADAPEPKADPNVPLHVKVSLPYLLFLSPGGNFCAELAS